MSSNGRPEPILFVHHRPELGGAPQSLFYLLQALDRTRFEPHVFCPPGPAAELFREAGAEVHTGAMAGFTHIWASTYSGRRWLLFSRELWHLPRHIADLRRVLAIRPFRLVHLNDSPLIPAAMTIHRAGIPIVWHLRSALPDDGLRSAAVRWAVRHYSTAAIAISEDVARSFQVDATVVPNAVDLDRFKPGDAAAARESLQLPNDRPIISFFGYIYPSKGFQDFISAAGLIQARGMKASFLVIGGSVRDEGFFESLFGRSLQAMGLAQNYLIAARKLVHDLGLEDSVNFVPFTRETALLYQASDIIVSPSRGPELGRPIVEAAACGRPVIASGSLGGAGLLISNKTGYLVPRRSPHMIAIVVEHLMRDEKLRLQLGVDARHHAEQTFNAEITAGRVMDVYDRVMQSS